MAKSKLTMAGLDKRLDQVELSINKILNILNSRGNEAPSKEECKPSVYYPNLSEITEIGAEVDLYELGKIRLLDTNYNGTGKKIWQFVNVLKPKEVNLGLPNDNNKGGYPSAEGVSDVLNDIFESLPAEIRNQIVDMEIPCYIPETKETINHSDPIFLLSATEMCQNRSYLAKEGRPLEFYIKNTPEFNDWHWLRTPYLDYSNYWGIVISDGSVYYSGTYIGNGVAPAFCTD